MSNIDAVKLSNELKNIIILYKDLKPVHENANACLKILRYFDFVDNRNAKFAKFILAVLNILKAKANNNQDLTTDLSNILARNYILKQDRIEFNYDDALKSSNDFSLEVERFIERNLFDEEYDRINKIIAINNIKLISNPQKSILYATMHLVDAQELILRLEKIIIYIFAVLINDIKICHSKNLLINDYLYEVEKKKEKLLQIYSKIHK